MTNKVEKYSKKYRYGHRGFTLIESMVGIAIFLMLAGVVYQTFFIISKQASLNWESTTISSLADQYLEVARNIPYAQIGTIQGNPHGSLPDLPNATSVVVNSVTYQIYYEVTFVDDSADGKISLGTDPAPDDYKQVKLSVKNTVTNVVTVFVTNIVPTGLENWIGKSVGAELDFLIEGRNQRITVFTTRADTIFSGAFIVLAPEHEMVKDLTTSSQKDAVMDYINQSIRKSDIERQADKEKSGVFTGSYVFNPANGEKMPVWVGDFVLAGYGTGAVFGDIHDERDFEFLKKYGIPAKPTVLPEDEIEAQKVLNKEYPYTGEGVLIDSGEFTGMRSEIARDKIIAWLAGKGLAREKVNYKMRDWSVSRQRYWGAPIPIIYCEKCGPQLVPDADLPVVLPELKDFSPSGDGRSALARATDWVQTKCPKCGGEAERETDTLDTYICSSWYMLRYLDPANSEKIFESPVANKWMPVDFYNGADHATAHMLYARFVTRFFHKKGLVENPEPFKKFLFNGKVTAADGQMFSKSKGNGVDPLEIIPEYGADALRTYLMFAAPLDVWIRWDPQGVPSALRFLNRVWTLVYEFIKTPESAGRNEVVLRATHKTVKKVTFDLENQKYNTAIASMMELVNALNGEKNENGFVDTQAWKFGLESLVQLIAPFAPHMADELWQILGHEDSVQKDHWPIWDEALVREGMATIVIQINGKMRGKVILPTGATEEVVRAAALGDEKIETALGGSEVKRVIFIPDKLLNLVV
jgi:leucyl-tRNA synthetase